MNRPEPLSATDKIRSMARTGTSIYVSVIERLVAPLLVVATAMIGLSVSIIVLQMILRNTIGTAPPGINTLATWLAAWASLLLIGVLIWQDEHLKIEVLYEQFSSRIKRAIRTVQLLAYTFFGFVLAYWGYVYTIELGDMSTAPGLGVQMTWLYSSIVIGGVLMMAFSVAKLLAVYESDDALTSSMTPTQETDRNE